MDPEDIKFALRKAGATLASLGKQHGVSRQTMSIALHARVSARAEQIIADYLGLHPMKIWPSRYDNLTGERLSLLAQRSAVA